MVKEMRLTEQNVVMKPTDFLVESSNVSSPVELFLSCLECLCLRRKAALIGDREKCRAKIRNIATGGDLG